MYLSRHHYDKPWRCPGWAGGGWSHPEAQSCPGGWIPIYDVEVSWPRWRSYRCNKCDVRTIPLVTRWVDPTWLTFWLGRLPGRLVDRLEFRWWRRERRSER